MSTHGARRAIGSMAFSAGVTRTIPSVTVFAMHQVGFFLLVLYVLQILMSFDNATISYYYIE